MPNSAPIVVIERTLLPIGSHTSISVPWQQPYTTVAVQADLSDEDLADPSVNLIMYVDTSRDKGQTWSTGSSGFSGGTNNPITGGLSVPLIEAGGDIHTTHVRMRYDLEAPLSIGCTMYFEP